MSSYIFTMWFLKRFETYIPTETEDEFKKVIQL